MISTYIHLGNFTSPELVMQFLEDMIAEKEDVHANHQNVTSEEMYLREANDCWLWISFPILLFVKRR